MHPKDTRHPAEAFCALVVAANLQVAREARLGVSALFAKWRGDRLRDRERTQLANMSEREWSDLGLSKSDVAREVEKPGRVP